MWDRTDCMAGRVILRHHDLTTALRPSQQVVKRPLRKRTLKQNKTGTDLINNTLLQQGTMP